MIAYRNSEISADLWWGCVNINSRRLWQHFIEGGKARRTYFVENFDKTRKEITELDISGQKLEGALGFANLEILDCAGRKKKQRRLLSWRLNWRALERDKWRERRACFRNYTAELSR